MDTIDAISHTQMKYAAEPVQVVGVLGDTVPRFQYDATGLHSWGTGAAAPDVQLQRLAPGVLGVPPGGSFQSSSPIIPITTNTTVNGLLHNGATLLFNAATGATLTLPSATGSGNTFIIANAVTLTSGNNIVQVANSSDSLVGNTYIFSAGTPSGFSTANTGTLATESDTITMNGTTKGGIKGDYIELIDLKANVWLVRGELNGSGVAITPFSAAV